MRWFESLRDDELRQGEFIWACPCVQFLGGVESIQTADIGEVHAVILTQSCDLLVREDGHAKARTVLLAQFHTREELAFDRHFGRASAWEEVRKGRTPRFHVTDRIAFARGVDDFLMIDLASTFSLDFHLTRQAVRSNAPCPALVPPYREHLSQAFARYYMRVGLPSDIPPFR